MERVAVVGAGAMGRQIALACAIQGLSVALTDAMPEALDRAQQFAGEYLEGRVAKGKMTAATRDGALRNLRFVPALAEAVAGTGLVIEAIIERYEAKRDLFQELDALCPPETILASNSSNIVPSRLAAATRTPARVLNLHFFNPPLVMELVEVVVHPAVPETVQEAAMAFCRRIGKAPVLIKREIPGFIVNRIFRALTREALTLYEEGYASAADIDLAVTKGLGHPMGPFTLMDMTGVDVCYLARQDQYLDTGEEAARPNRILKEMYERGEWGRKTGKGFYTYPKPEQK